MTQNNNSNNNSNSLSQPVLDLELLNSNDKSALSIYNDPKAKSASSLMSSNPISFTSSLLGLIWGKPSSGATTATNMPSLSDKNVITLTDDADDDFSHVGFRPLSYAEVATMSKTLHPQPTDKPSKTVVVPISSVYGEAEHEDDDDDDDYDHEEAQGTAGYGEESLLAMSTESLYQCDGCLCVQSRGLPLPIQGEFLDGDRARAIVKQARTEPRCRNKYELRRPMESKWGLA